MPLPQFELAAFTKVLPVSTVLKVLEEVDALQERRRKLPSEVVLWLLVGMGLFRGLSIPNALRRVVAGLTGLVAWGPAEVPCSTALAHARDRLGFDAVREIFRRLADVLFGRYAQTTTWRGLGVYVLDGVCFMVPDSKKNDDAFGRAGVTRGGASGFPQLRGVLLVAAWSHLVVRAAFGAYRKGEITLAFDLVPQLPSGALLLLDRGYYAYVFLVQLLRRETFFVVRAKTKGRCMAPKTTKRLGPNDVLARLQLPPSTKWKNPSLDLPPTLDVRVVTYKKKGWPAVKLVTNLLDPERYPAEAIAELYHDRWEIELSYREIKTHLVANQVAFRSKTPTRVLQEAYGLLLAYDCVRALMADAAIDAGVQPRALSFTSCLERIRVALPSLAAANDKDAALRDLLDDLARCLLPQRRAGRSCPRVVKIKMSHFPRKRPAVQVRSRSRRAS